MIRFTHRTNKNRTTMDGIFHTKSYDWSEVNMLGTFDRLVFIF